jgi:sugar lactone lactonase YvrE
MLGIPRTPSPRFSAVLLSSLLTAALGASGCDCNGDDDDNPGNPSGAGASGAGGSGGNGNGNGDGILEESSVVVETSSPLDAAPSKDGSVVYFTAIGESGAGVYSVPAGGGDPLEVAVGDPFVFPLGIAVSTDGKTLYVADLGVEGSEQLATDGGKIFQVSAEGGTPSEVLTTDNTFPRGLDVVEEDGGDTIYYSGTTSTGEPALFKVPADGGEPTPVASGAPLRDPAAVAVAGEVIYVLDTIASSRSLASIVSITDGKAEEFVAHLDVGYPGGMALSQDGSALLVSGFDDAKGTSAVLRVDIVSKEITTFPEDDIYLGFDEPGGLHRAKGADVYTFVDGSGTIFLLE